MDNKWSTSDSTSMASSTFPQTAKLRQFGRTTALDSINSNGQEHTATGGRQPSTDVTSGSLTSMASPNIPTSAHRVQVTFSESRKRWRRPVCSPCQSRSRETGRKPCSRRVTAGATTVQTWDGRKKPASAPEIGFPKIGRNSKRKCGMPLLEVTSPPAGRASPKTSISHASKRPLMQHTRTAVRILRL